MTTATRPPTGPAHISRDAIVLATRKHQALRAAIAMLEAFLALTTIACAITVVPALPRSYLRWGPFTDFTIPALALGIICGGSALLALALVLTRPRIGALATVFSGVAMIIFELVEIAVVGFTAVMSPDQPVAWLQMFFIVFGAALIVLGARLWKAETGSYELARARF